MNFLLFLGLLSVTVPLPNDPFEVATGEIHVVDTPTERASVLAMLNDARDNLLIRQAGVAFDLKVAFNVNSGGQTQYDGAWEMEDITAPGVGFRWAARTGSYAIDQMGSGGIVYGDTAQIPLRLQQVRGSLLAPAMFNMSRALLRTASVNYEGAQLTCVLLSNGHNDPNSPVAGRHWEESEQCLDVHTGLLRISSPAPGLYFYYDYSDAHPFHGKVFPGKMTIYEAGRAVLEAQVQSLTDIPNPHPATFTPTEQMKTKGAGAQMGGWERFPLQVPSTEASTGAVHPVLVMGLLTTADQMQELHVIETSDASLNERAIELVKQTTDPLPSPPGSTPEQRIVIVNVRFP